MNLKLKSMMSESAPADKQPVDTRNGGSKDVSQVKAYPLALQLSQGIHHLCNCMNSSDWPYCKNEGSVCETRRHTLELSKPRFIWLCQCAASGDMPFCDGEGHIAVEKSQR